MSNTTKLPESVRMTRHVRELEKAPGVPFSDAEYAVLEELCWHYNEENRDSFPSAMTMGRRIGRDERQVRRILDALEATEAPGVGSIIECIGNKKGGQSGGKGLPRKFALRVMQWPYIKPAVTRRSKVGGHSDVRVLGGHSDVRVLDEVGGHSDAKYPDISDQTRRTSDAKYPDISAKVGGHLDVRRTSGEPLDLTRRENHNQEPKSAWQRSLGSGNGLAPTMDLDSCASHEDAGDTRNDSEPLTAMIAAMKRHCRRTGSESDRYYKDCASEALQNGMTPADVGPFVYQCKLEWKRRNRHGQSYLTPSHVVAQWKAQGHKPTHTIASATAVADQPEYKPLDVHALLQRTTADLDRKLADRR